MARKVSAKTAGRQVGQKVIAQPQALERIAEAIRDAKRKFNLQNTAGLSFEVEARFALQIISNSKSLLECAPETAKDAMIDLAATGLSLNPANQHATLQARWNSRLRRTEITFFPMYRGLVKLATDTGSVKSVRSDIVFECEQDSFDCDLGDKPFLTHKPKLFAPREERVVNLVNLDHNKMVGSYCIAYLRDSEYPHITLMDLGEILTIARCSEAFNPRDPDKPPSGPWVLFGGEMTKKATIKRAQKQWPMTDSEAAQRLRNAIAIDDRNEVNEQVSELDEDELRGELGEKMSPEQVERIRDLCATQELPVSTVSEAYGVNGLSKIPAKYYDEIEQRLLKRQRQLNEAKYRPIDGSMDAGAKDGEQPAKEGRGKATDKGRKG